MEHDTPALPFSVLIAAAGSGSRLGGDIPKQYQIVGGKMLLRHTIEAFLGCTGLKELRVTIDPNHANLYQSTASGLNLAPPILGGKTRKQSVYNGLCCFSDLEQESVILIHDGARPLIDPQSIHRLILALQTEQAATLAVPIADTLIKEDGRYVDRSGTWAVQTPQGFHYGILKKAHEQSTGDATDDTALVAALGIKVALVQGTRQNFKVTTPDDMLMLEHILASRTETRTASGFDVHRFSTERGSVRLCGIDVPHEVKLEGHSDADVGLHALTDALLGTIAAGDIGSHFPPSDPQWKGADSAIFLQEAVRLVKEKGGSIVNLDLTIICERPKITPHREAMQKRVAEICDIEQDRVSIKATTTERLGFTGRSEGIAAQALATVRLYPADKTK